MNRTRTAAATPPVWKSPEGKPLTCYEKIKVLNENIAEIEQLAGDALEDGVLMGCDERQVRRVLHDLVDRLKVKFR
ncbi:MAG TPA: hypothetical protein VEU47_17950 [Candidatus Cybelea sp.]|nr:hypothetical protein [Candidatus Cybelea sp.]